MNRTSSRFVLLALLGLSACGGGGGGGGGGGPGVAPTGLAYSVDTLLGISQVSITPLLPTVSGAVSSYHVAPPLPSGLVLDPLTGAITGTPLVASELTTYDVTAQNSAGSAHARLELQVVRAPRMLYSISAADDSITFFTNDVTNGELRRIGQVVTGGAESGPETLVFHPNGRFAYAPNQTTSNVSVFAVDAQTGWLDRAAPAACGTGPHRMAIDATGRFAYVTNRGSNQLDVFSIHPTTGALTPVGAPITTGTQPSDLAFDATGGLLFVTMRGADNGVGSQLAAFRVDATNGTLTSAGAPLALNGGRPVSLGVDPRKPIVYLALEAFDDVLPVRFDLATGTLVPQSLHAAGDQPVAIRADVTGKFAYVVNQSSNNLKAYRIDDTTSALNEIETYLAGIAPTAITVDPAGRFAYVATRDSGEILTFSIDRTTGALTQIGTSRVRGTPTDLVLALGDRPIKSVPRFVHVAGKSSGDVTSYRINAQNGTLTQTGVSATGVDPSAIAIDPRLRYAWVSNAGSGSISIFNVDASNGILTSVLPAQPLAGKPSHVAVDPSGRFVFATSRDVLVPDDGYMTAYTINRTTGGLTPISTTYVGFNPTSLGVDPTGRFLYVANRGTSSPATSSIAVFSIDPQTGAPSVSAPAATTQGVFDLAFHPSGTWAYGVIIDANSIQRFGVDRTSGALTPLPPAMPAGTEPVALVFTPNGAFAYSAEFDTFGAGSVNAHRVLIDGSLSSPIQSINDGSHPYDLAIDPTGRFVYSTNAGSDTVSVARIDPVTGLLTTAIPVPTGVSPGPITLTSVTQ